VEKRVNAREDEYNRGNALIQGVAQKGEGEEPYIARYPSEGLAILTQMTQSLGGDINTARTLVARYAGDSPNVLNGNEVKDLYASAQDYLARLLGLQNRGQGLIAGARTQVDRANALKLDGDRLFQAAQAALNRSDFQAARSNFDRAQAQYTASLAIQESSAVKASWDRLAKLGEDIITRENEVVIREVRTMLTTAQTRYFAGNMDQAEQVLVSAQNRWRQTNVTDNPEVENWLTLVRGALSLQSGRTIPPTAPLYAEMSQLLSDANGSYNEGVRLLNSGRRTEGIAKFNEALAKTREVRLMFPMNYDARILELQIEQQTDPRAFPATFRQRLNEAVAGTKRKNVEAFAELQDLAAINPQYPGMKAIVTQAQIDMGYLPPLPNPADLARSAELTRAAQANINTRDQTRFSIAKAQLDEAIKLNPNNTQAQALLDQVQILMTGSGTLVMDSNTLAQYNAAQQAFLTGNYVSANAIVLRLLQNPKNQKSIQIQDLKKRIDPFL
ncbi:MAG: hypothetical protein FWC45_09020, partial [Treponema sp.]|nr:hypothetical protein [Treponema sp.]